MKRLFHYDPNPKDIVLAVDYHDTNCKVRQSDLASGEEQVLSIRTTAKAIGEVVDAAAARARARGGRVWWIMESTTGWARVKTLLSGRCRFVLANVVQMELPPKAYRRKTDKIDTGRVLREFLIGRLPEAAAPDLAWRSLRRLVVLREDLVRRRTALRNWVNRHLAHEHWVSRQGLWTEAGQQRLRAMTLPAQDRFVLDAKLDELKELETRLKAVVQELDKAYAASPAAQRLDAIRGLAPVAAISIVARIGPVARFADADELVGYAGLDPGVRQSDGPVRNTSIGHPATDKHLRHYVVEASVWAREIPRYRRRYERVAGRRGARVGRLDVARMLLRSIYKMLRDGCPFQQAPTDAAG